MKKRLGSILLACAMTLTLLPWSAMSARAAAETWSGEARFYTDALLADGVTLAGDTTLTVAAGKTLTVEKGIDCGDYTLTFAGLGSAVVTGAAGAEGIKGNVVVTGGTLTVNGGVGVYDIYGDGGDAINGSITLSGGIVTAMGGDGTSGSEGAGYGGYGVNGSVTQSGGALTVIGGQGSFGFDGGLGGMGVYGGVTLSGGMLTTVGGNGGSGGDGGGGPGGDGIRGKDESAVTLTGGVMTAVGGSGGSAGYGGKGGDGVGVGCICTVHGGILIARGGSCGESAYHDGDESSDGDGVASGVTLAGGAVKASVYSANNAPVTVADGMSYTINGGGAYAGELAGSVLSGAAGKWLTTGYGTGGCGVGVSYELIENGGAVGERTACTLLLSGEGAAADYGAANPAPWRSAPVTRAVIGAGVTGVDADSFSGCASLAAIDAEAGNPSYCSEDGVLFRVGNAGRELTCCPAGRDGADYAVPNGVTSIGAGAFSGCEGLVSIVIPASVASIGARAFSGCESLASICIPLDFDYSILDGSGIPDPLGTMFIPFVTVTPSVNGAASVSGSSVVGPVGSVLIAACYDGAGRQIVVELHEIAAATDGMCVFETLWTGAGSTCKLMLADKSTFAPLCAAWDSADQ